MGGNGDIRLCEGLLVGGGGEDVIHQRTDAYGVRFINIDNVENNEEYLHFPRQHLFKVIHR